MLRILPVPALPHKMLICAGVSVLFATMTLQASGQSEAILKAFATQPHTGPIEQALVGVETRQATAGGALIVRHGNGLVIRCDGFVLTSAALFIKPIQSPQYSVTVTLHPGAPDERRVAAALVMHPGMILRYFAGKPEPFVVIKIANVHTPALRLLLPDSLLEARQATLAWSHWDETTKHFQPVQKRPVLLAAKKREDAVLNRLAFAQPENMTLSGAAVIGPDGMGVGLINDPAKSPATSFSTFATLNTTTNCVTPQSVTDARFADLHPVDEKPDDAKDGAASGEKPASAETSAASQNAPKNTGLTKPPAAPADASPAIVSALASDNKAVPHDMVAVPGGPVQLASVLRLYQTDMTNVRVACVAPFLMDKYEVTNGQYYQFWQSLTPDEKKQHGADYYPIGWNPREPPFPPEMRDVPVLGVRLVGAQAYATWAGKRLPTPYEWCLGAFGPGGGADMPAWVKRYTADKQATWQHIIQAHNAFVQRFPVAGKNDTNAFLPWLYWYPFESASVEFSYQTIMDATAHLWRDWIDPQHVLPGGSRPFDVSPYGAYDIILNADELIMPYQAYRNRVFTPDDGSVKELYMQISFPGPDSKDRNQVSGPYGPDAFISYIGPEDIFQGYREPLLSRRLRGPANYPWQDASYLDFMQAHARIKEVSDMMYTAQALLCLEPGPTIEFPDTFTIFSPPHPVQEEDAGSLRTRYGVGSVPASLLGPVRIDFYQSKWYGVWRNAAVPTHREMGREAALNSFVPFNLDAPVNNSSLYLVPGGFRCVR